ncbi:HIT family protein [archaeon]|nr:HIT family protein [archaeon]
MNNPLTKEQIKKLNEISQLKGKEQQEELQKFLGTLNEEQVEFLKQSQQQQGGEGECFFCKLVMGDVPTKKIYEDENYLAVLNVRPLTKGQVLLLTKKHEQFSFQVPEDIWIIINKIISKLYDVYQCDTSVVFNNGNLAGQRLPHFSVHIIPKYKDDNVNFILEGQEADLEKLEKVREELEIEEEIIKKVPREVEEIELEEKERIA